MNKYMVLGMRKIPFKNNKLNGHNCNFSKEDFSDFKYQIIVIKGSELYQIEGYTTHGQCGSGWSTASWGQADVTKVEEVGSLHFTPNEFTELDDNIYGIWPSRIENNLFTYSEYGFDSYYPSGHFTIHEGNWRPTGRLPEKPMLHVFWGRSSTGKSTIASLTGKEVVETDQFDEVEEISEYVKIAEMADSILVIGNKHTTITSVGIPGEWKKTLEEKYTLVEVEFK